MTIPQPPAGLGQLEQVLMKCHRPTSEKHAFKKLSQPHTEARGLNLAVEPHRAGEAVCVPRALRTQDARTGMCKGIEVPMHAELGPCLFILKVPNVGGVSKPLRERIPVDPFTQGPSSPPARWEHSHTGNGASVGVA